MKKTIKIAISGALGKMGTSLIKESKNFKNIKLNLLILKKINKKNQKKLKKLIKIKKNNILIEDNIKKNKNFDILIDFTNPKNTMKNLKFCYNNNKKIIIGTTGLTEKHYIDMKKKSKKISILYSSNFSVGINLLLKLLEITTKNIGLESDIEISESHHRYKIDSPSGTALTLGKKIAKTLKKDFNNISNFEKNTKKYKRKKNEIGFNVIRAGEIIGNHSILFINKEEKIEIKHQAFSRKTFSKGAIKAAIWINNKKNGLFTMENVLKK
ncbi:4-hydroxy-tetrahydrodipicolinate reductase [Buchnera aphidicola (Periphyllus testudinaceus)]|uniref:4-hydroxy-tetrahydrodipicolinate reductase n=1 Tax=Buchnera aphidicola TaxID=9 RepID=UPI0034641647